MTMVDHGLASRVGKRLDEQVDVERLPGDASDRSFYRVHRCAPRPALILMVQKGSFEPDDSPYCQVQGLFERIGLPVPRIERLFPAEGWILMTDVGRTTLQEYLARNGLAAAPPAYSRAVDILLTLQTRGTPQLPGDFHGARQRLDREKLSSELRFTWTHLLRGLLRVTPSDQEADLLDGWADEVGRRLGEDAQVLCHRDYHSRNLMWDGGQMGVVDFQDARLGPVTYDLASLLYDPYIDLEENLREEMIWRFLDGRETGREGEAPIRDQLDLAVAQRCLKAAGTYAFQAVSRGRRDFLDYLGPALRNAFLALRRFPEYDPVLRLLQRYAAAAAPA